MPRFPFRVTSLSVLGLALIAACSAPASAQDMTPNPAPDTVPAAPVAAPPSAPPDYALLQKSMSSVASASALTSDSDFDLSGTKSGASVTMHEHLKTTVKKPGKFRAEITLGAAGAASPTRYLVVSDGLKVLTVQPGAKQYSINTLSDFKASDQDLPALGIFAGPVFLGEFADALAALPKESEQELNATLKKQGMSLSSQFQTVDGVNFAVYTINIQKSGVFRFFLDPDSGALKQIELKGSENGTDFDMVEKIVTTAPAPAITKATFLIAPPAGTHKIKMVDIGSF